MIKHFHLMLTRRMSCGMPTVGAIIPGYNPDAPRATPEETTFVRSEVTCPGCKKAMGGVDATKIKLTPAQIGVMLYLAGRWRDSNAYPKPKESTYDRLVTVRLVEPSDIFPYHKVTDDGRHWLHANDPR